MKHARSKRTAVLKRLFAIKKGWLDPVTNELRRPLHEDRDEDDNAPRQIMVCVLEIK